tara:strand:- start:7922 stop:8125 length:204 start_codon:yes stop_codon:yes gene_type:complete
LADFKIQSTTAVAGVALIQPQTEDAWRYLVDECDYHVMSNGSAPVDHELVGDFISDAASCYLEVDYL